ncbi:uncharacterized protein LOC134212877 [Armigeres subalbatus]|uniref:uncharacterized protein LOC134212877 n=1 Tax=Armigeres subalbatus TaxID=124917 RepID=UPI002ED235F2
MDSDAAQNKKIACLEEKVREATAMLEEQHASYEKDLKQFYALKAKEIALELKFESWKQLYRKQEAELDQKFARMREIKLNIWDDREKFCDDSSTFVRQFSLPSTLIQLRRAERQAEDGYDARQWLVKHFDYEARLEQEAHLQKMAQVDEEIAELQQREAELDDEERELAPGLETVRRLQEAVTNSVSCLEEIQENIKVIQNRKRSLMVGAFEAREVRSILKRPSFLDRKIERKQVRFE